MQATIRSSHALRPTRWALLLSTMTLVILLMSMNFGLSLGYFMSFLLLSIILVSAVSAWFNLANLELMLAQPAPVFLGQTIKLQVSLINNASENKYGIGLATTSADTQFADIDARSQKIICLTIRPDHRGWWSVPPLKLHSTFPLGLFSVSARLFIEAPVLIYPKPATHDAGTSEKYSKPHAAQEDTHSFNGHRSYVTGDALRHIDWKAFSRHQKMLIKTYTPEESSECWLDWQSTIANNDEQKIAMLARDVLNASQLQGQYGLRLPNGLIKPGQGLIHAQKCLKALALL